MKKYGLDLLDRKILYELDKNSRMTFKQLGKKIGISKETATFRVKRLVKNKYIKNFITTIHTSNLNRFYYKLFYKFYGTTPEIDREIVDYIQNYQSVAYFASSEGRYDVLFLILAKDMRDLYKFLVLFRERFGGYILEQEIVTLPSVHRFNFRFFYEDGELLHTKYPVELVEPRIDEMDYKIISEIAKNARISLTEIAKITKTDINVIKYRMNKLKKSNIIGTHVLEINFEKFGLQQIQIGYTLKNHKSINKMIEYVAQNPKSTFATVMLGKYDLAVEFFVENMEELRRIMNGIKKEFSGDITNHDVFILKEHTLNWFPYKLGNFETKE
ncbi:MAG: Lrp/AsnC family transcriptional regulator [Candidatus Micrarchaeota archaeon]